MHPIHTPKQSFAKQACAVSLAVLGLSIFTGAQAHADKGGIFCTQTGMEIGTQLQAGRQEPVTQCEVNQVISAELQHVELTGGDCDAKSKTHFIRISKETSVIGQDGGLDGYVAKVTVATEGVGQAADTFIVEGRINKNSTNVGDCTVVSVKLAPMDDGLPSPVEKPNGGGRYPRQ